jgi:hypothetical protein
VTPQEREVWESAADILDPGAARRRKFTSQDEAALATPVTLAAHLQRSYRVRRHLTLIGDLYARINAGEFDRAVIATPPQVGKTVSAVVWAAFWWLILHPQHRIIIVCYGDSLAVKRGRAVRRLVEEFGKRFGLTPDPASQAAHDWALTTGGGVRAVGIGSGITGEPGDLIIIDDPHKNREEAESPTIREKVGDAYSADILTRLAPKAPLVIVNTRWHPDDLTGRVVAQEGPRTDGGRWEMLVMPALCTDPVNDPLGRSAGDPLPHPKIQEHDRAGALAHWQNAQKTNVPRDWFSMYQADPRPVEGAMVSAQILKERRCYEFGTERPCNVEPVIHAVAIDPSGGGRDNAGVVAGYLGSDERLYATHDRSARMKSEEWSRVACILAAEIGADRFIIEKNYGGDMCQLAVRTAWVALAKEEADERAANPGVDHGPLKYGPLIPRVVEVTARKNKILRAEPIAQQIIYDRLRFAAYLPTIEHQWATYLPTSTDSPGNLDAVVYLAYDLLPMPASGEPTIQESPQMYVDLTRSLSPSDGMMGGYGDLDWR